MSPGIQALSKTDVAKKAWVVPGYGTVPPEKSSYSLPSGYAVAGNTL